MERLTRLAFPALLALAAYYAVFGGEYSVFELRRARAEAQVTRARLDSLERLNDSLRARADSLENDLTTLERIAREQFGMIRDGEVLYRFPYGPPPADTVDAASAGG